MKTHSLKAVLRHRLFAHTAKTKAPANLLPSPTPLLPGRRDVGTGGGELEPGPPVGPAPPRTAVPPHRGPDGPHICSPGPGPPRRRSCQPCLAVPNRVAQKLLLLLFVKQRGIQWGLGGLSRPLLVVARAGFENSSFQMAGSKIIHFYDDVLRAVLTLSFKNQLFKGFVSWQWILSIS